MQVPAGTDLGGYHIESLIGAGGMGEVYVARDARLHRSVAVKFLSADLATVAFDRFEREARTASSLNHPHIVSVFQVGEWQGRPYLVTEFVDGGTLRDWTSREKRSWPQILALMTGVAD